MQTLHGRAEPAAFKGQLRGLAGVLDIYRHNVLVRSFSKQREKARRVNTEAWPLDVRLRNHLLAGDMHMVAAHMAERIMEGSRNFKEYHDFAYQYVGQLHDALCDYQKVGLYERGSEINFQALKRAERVANELVQAWSLEPDNKRSRHNVLYYTKLAREYREMRENFTFE